MAKNHPSKPLQNKKDLERNYLRMNWGFCGRHLSQFNPEHREDERNEKEQEEDFENSFKRSKQRIQRPAHFSRVKKYRDLRK